MSKAKSGTVIPAAEAAQGKARLAGCEARIETGLKSFADVGQALAEIRDSRLYMLSHTTFEDYCAQRWDMSRSRAYQLVEAAAVVSKILDKNMPPPAIESHAAALAAAPEHLRGQVWAKVREATGGKPTARAVTAAAEAAKRDYEAAEPVTAEEKAVYGEAYEAARPAGGGAPAYIAAGREAVAAHRAEQGIPAAEPLSAPVTPLSRSAAEARAREPLPAQQPARAAEARARTESIRAGVQETENEILVCLLRGDPPEVLAAQLEEWWKRFRAEWAGDDPERLEAAGSVWEYIASPEIEAIRAWPYGRYADAILAEDDELAALFREKFRHDEELQPSAQPELDADGNPIPDDDAWLDEMLGQGRRAHG